MRPNPIRTRLANRQPCLGIWLSLASPFSARLLARQPVDWLAIDAEHTPLDTSVMAHMIACIAEAHGPAPIVRLSQVSAQNVKHALDGGAYGLIAPMINTRQEAEQVVSWSRYPPLGQRSYGSHYMGLAFDTSMLEYQRQANAQVLVAVQIENAAALDNLDAICSVPGVDLVFVGPADLSISLGLDIVMENPHPRFQEALRLIQATAEKYHLPLGIYCSSGKAAAERIRQGFLFVNVTSDVNAMTKAVEAELAAARV